MWKNGNICRALNSFTETQEAIEVVDDVMHSGMPEARCCEACVISCESKYRELSSGLMVRVVFVDAEVRMLLIGCMIACGQ